MTAGTGDWWNSRAGYQLSGHYDIKIDGDAYSHIDTENRLFCLALEIIDAVGA